MSSLIAEKAIGLGWSGFLFRLSHSTNWTRPPFAKKVSSFGSSFRSSRSVMVMPLFRNESWRSRSASVE